MPKSALPSEPLTEKMVEVHREERVSDAGVHLGSCLDNRAEITSKVSARGHLVIFGILLSVNVIKQNQDVNSVTNVLFTHRQVEDQPSKKPKKNGDKSAVALLKSTRQLGCVFQDLEPLKSSSISQKSTQVSRPIRCVKFSKAVLRHADIRESKDPPLGVICPADPHERRPYAPNFEDRSQEEAERQERCALGDAERHAKST